MDVPYKKQAGGALMYSERPRGLNTMLKPINIHILLIYNNNNQVHVVECCLYMIFHISGTLRHFWYSYTQAISHTPSNTLVFLINPCHTDLLGKIREFYPLTYLDGSSHL